MAFSHQDPQCSWGSVLTARHSCSSWEAWSRADHCGPGVFLHAAGQKACRVPQTERGHGGRRTPRSQKLQENSCALIVGDLEKQKGAVVTRGQVMGTGPLGSKHQA